MRTPTLLLLVGLSPLLNAQWSTDPANPLVVCNAPNGQANVRAISDGNGGWFTFWADARVDPYKAELYGQHLDEAGNALWAANGLLIQSKPDSTVMSIAPVLLWNGTILVGYIYGSGAGYDGRVEVVHMDQDGTQLWPAPVELARSGPGTLGNIFGFANLKALASGTTAFFAWSFVPQGGNDMYAYERVAENGDVQFGDLGNVVPNSGWGPFSIHSDLLGGLVFDWRQGNGAGAPLLAMRMNVYGDPAWPSNLTVSTGTTGLSYAYGTVGDGLGSIFSSWVSANDLPMARYDTSGTFEWTPTPFFACNESHVQDNPQLVINDGFLFVGWGDGRPPAANQDMYVQKFNMAGAPQWTTDGVAAIQAPTYIPTPGLVPSDDGAVIATFDTGSPGFCAMRLLDDGSADWPAPTAFCTGTFNPFYADQVKLPDGAGGVVAFWSDQNEVYAARIYKNGELGDHTGIADGGRSIDGLQLHPSPTNGPMSVLLPDGSQLRSIRVIDAQGRDIAVSTTRTGDRLHLDVNPLPDGIYTLELATDAVIRTGRFIVAR